jgi:N-hydroxyarylamine O-acetyltransferase
LLRLSRVNRAIDLRRYFGRIGWTGERSPTYATLAGILHAHTASIPLENLDVLLARPPRLDLGSLEAKLVDARRGGYCFEHATLFSAVLAALGFQPIAHAARVVLNAPRDASPRTHMFLTVATEGRTFVVDPGFGRLASRAPVPLASDGRNNATHWMTRDGHFWILRAKEAGNDFDCWVSTLEAENGVDFEVANHYTATHAASPFVNRLLLRAITDDGYVTVMNRDVTRVRADAAQTSRLADRAQLRALPNDDFGFDLPDVASLRVPSIDGWDA